MQAQYNTDQSGCSDSGCNGTEMYVIACCASKITTYCILKSSQNDSLESFEVAVGIRQAGCYFFDAAVCEAVHAEIELFQLHCLPVCLLQQPAVELRD